MVVTNMVKMIVVVVVVVIVLLIVVIENLDFPLLLLPRVLMYW